MAKKANTQNVDDVQHIRQALKKKGWTQQKLAEMSGLTPQQISRCFSRNRFPDPSKNAIFATLGINVINSDVAKSTVNALPSFVGFVEYKGETTKLNDVTDLLKLSSEIQNDIAPSEVKANGKDLMSNILQTNVPKAFKVAEQFDSTELRRFLQEDSNIPLIAVSIGGSKAAGVYAKTLYGMYDGMATSVTFYMLNALSDAVIANSKVLFISGGKDIDIMFAVERVLKLTNRVGILTHRSSEYATERIRSLNPKNVFEHDAKLFNGEFVSTAPMFLNCSILYKAFSNKNDFIERLGVDKISMKTSDNYTFETNFENLKYSCPKLSNIRTFHVLHGVASETVAYDMKSKLTESGIAATIISDYRTFCHGEFIYASNHVENPNNIVIPSDTAIVLLVTPREFQIVNEIRTKALAQQMPIIIIRSEIEDDALAVLDLLLKENVLICKIGESRRVNPTSPQNYANIDKRKPRSDVRFEKDFASRGCLRASWDGKNVSCVSENEDTKIVVYKEINRSKDKRAPFKMENVEIAVTTELKRKGRPKGSKNKTTSREDPTTSEIPSDILSMPTSNTKVKTVKGKKEMTKEYTVEWAKKLLDEGENIKFFQFYGHNQKGETVDKSCLSQWFMRDFEVEGVKYNCMEQYMMASKARLFGDDEMLDKIMKSSVQKTIKAYGRKVKNFDAKIWEDNCFDIVVKGNMAKFSQNEDLKQFILSTGNDILVEASPTDKIWGIGMREGENGSNDPSSWKGTNLLGFALTKVRNSLKLHSI